MAVRWLVTHPSGKWLYALVSFSDQHPGELRTFAIRDTGLLDDESRAIPSGGYEPCHAEIHRGHWLAVAHRLSGDVAVFSIRGGLPVRSGAVRLPSGNEPAPVASDSGAFVAPLPGAPMASAVAFAPSSRHLVAADAGQAALVSIEFDSDTDELSKPVTHPMATASVAGPGGQVLAAQVLGGRPHRVAFWADGHCLLCLHESSNMLTVHRFNPDTGRISAPH